MKKTIRSTQHAFLALAAALTGSLPILADEGSRLAATDFGSGSGQVGGTSQLGCQLVLELLDGDTDQPRLRLFGGLPGNQAALWMSSEAFDVAFLDVGGQALAVVPRTCVSRSGVFNAEGAFEVLLPSVKEFAANENVFARGAHQGLFGLQPWVVDVLEVSHGLELARHDDATPSVLASPPTWDALAADLPADRSAEIEAELQAYVDALLQPGDSGDERLVEALRSALNSPGDSLQLDLALEIAPEVLLGGGGSVALAARVSHLDEGYEVAFGIDVAILGSLGFSAGPALEASGEASGGGGLELILEFHSLHALVRGLKGIGLIGYEVLPFSAHSLREEEILWLEARLETVSSSLATATALRDAAQDGLDSAVAGLTGTVESAYLAAKSTYEARTGDVSYWSGRRSYCGSLAARYPRNPYYRVQYSAAHASYLGAASRAGAARLVLVTAQSSYDAAATGVQLAQDGLEQACDCVQAVLNELASLEAALAKIHRAAWSLAQTRSFVLDHVVAYEFAVASAAEATSFLAPLTGFSAAEFNDGFEFADLWASVNLVPDQKATVEQRLTFRLEPDGAGWRITSSAAVVSTVELEQAYSYDPTQTGEIDATVQIEVRASDCSRFEESADGKVEVTPLATELVIRGDFAVLWTDEIKGISIACARELFFVFERDNSSAPLGQDLRALLSLDPARMRAAFGASAVKLGLQDRRISQCEVGRDTGAALTWQDTSEERAWSASAEDVVDPLLDLIAGQDPVVMEGVALDILGL